MNAYMAILTGVRWVKMYGRGCAFSWVICSGVNTHFSCARVIIGKRSSVIQKETKAIRPFFRSRVTVVEYLTGQARESAMGRDSIGLDADCQDLNGFRSMP